MKKSWSSMSLLVALIAGAASAQAPTATPPSTAAGTVITNTAEITYTPEGSTTPTTTPSNPVETTVLPKPSFSITPNDNNGAGSVSEPHYQVPGQTQTAKPCDEVVFPYQLTNTGNVNNESYTLTNTPDPTGTVKTPENIRYYLDANSDGVLQDTERTTPITKLTDVDINETVKFFQVYVIPCTATDTDKYGADPTGTRDTNPEFPNAGTVPVDANNSNTTTVDRKDGVVIGPKNDPNGASDATVTPPYQSTDPTPVTITPNNNDEQVANAVCSTTQVTFTNTVKNTGNRTDTFNITTSTANLPAGSTVTLYKMEGGTLVALTDSASDTDALPDTGPLAVGATYDVYVRVTMPACAQPTLDANGNPLLPTVTVTATSTNDPTKSDPTKDIINLPGLSFGDATGPKGGDPTKEAVATPDPVDLTQCVTSVKASLPMDIANFGTLPDTFDLTGSVTFTLTDGTTTAVPVKYYVDTNQNGQWDAGDTLLGDSNGNTKQDTGSMLPGAELKLVGVVDVPCNTKAGTYTVTQTAESPTTGTKVTDNNDKINVGTTPVAKPTKDADKATAFPGETVTYTIVGKNTSNANITKAFVCDAPPTNTTYQSFSATSTQTGAVRYSTDGGNTWSAAAPTTAQYALLPAGTKVCAGVDTNGDGNVTTADILAPGNQINVTFQVKIN